jgi:kexin
MTSANIANAMVGSVNGNTDRFSAISVSNNSWGDTDGLGTLGSRFADSTWKAAIENGVNNGRGGKGIIYLWAAGNGGHVDNSNYDSQANYRSVIAVGGADAEGNRPGYAEPGANVLVSGLTLGDSLSTPPGIVSTTVAGLGSAAIDSSKNYVNDFSGTSAATPGVAGVVALMLHANPALSWRQVRWILAQTARQVNSGSSGWAGSALGAGVRFHHDYGYGVPNAAAAVALAKVPPSLGTLKSCERSLASTTGLGQTLTTTPTSFDFNVTSACSITQVEFVEIAVDFSHSFFGDLIFQLDSPAGYTSFLTENHTSCFRSVGKTPVLDNTQCDYSGGKQFTFGSVRHLGEAPQGTWSLLVVDADGNSGGVGSLSQAKLVLWGF